MTPSASTVRRTARDVVPVPPPGYPGCYWNWERAAWVAWAAVPQPRPPRD